MAGIIRQVTLRILGDSRDARVAMDWANRESDNLEKRKPTIHIMADTPTTKLTALKAALDSLTTKVYGIKLDPNDTATIAKLATVQQAVRALQSNYDKLSGTEKISLTALDRFATGVTQQEAAFSRLTDSAGRFNVALKDTEKTYRVMSGRGLGFIGASIPLFGSAAHAVGILHLAFDALLEVGIAVTTAAAALSVALYAMSGAAVDVWHHLQSVQAASAGLNTNIPPLTSKFSDLQRAMAPTVLEVYGGALMLVNKNSGILAQTAHTVGNMFGNWMAKITVWSQSQRTVGRLLQTGTAFLSQFGSMVGNVLLAIDNLMKADPGIAHFLFDVIGGFVKLFQLFTSLPRPIVNATLALHGIYLWGGLAVTALRRLAAAAGLEKLAYRLGLVNAEAKTLAGLSGRSWLGIAALVGFIVYAGVQSQKASPEVQRFIDQLNRKIDSEQASTAIADISNAIGALQVKMRTLDVSQIMKGWSNIGPMGQQWAQSLGADAIATGRAFGKLGADINHIFSDALSGHIPDMIGFAKDIGHFIHAAFVPGAGAVDIYHKSMDALRASEASFMRQEGNLAHEVGNLTTMQRSAFTVVGEGTGKIRMLGTTVHSTTRGIYSYQEALAIMDLAGVRASDHFDIMRAKVNNLLEGYRMMGVAAGILRGAVNATTFGIEFQNNKVATLTAGIQAFLAVVAGGDTQLVTFAQDMKSIGTVLAGGGTTARVQTLTFGKLSQAAKQAGTSFTGLNASSLQLRGTWEAALTQAGQMYSALLDQSAAAGLGARGTRLLSRAGKDLVAQLLSGAKASAANRAQVYALAQTVGYNGKDSFKALAQWVGNTHDTLGNLDHITTIFTKHASNLTGDVKNLSEAINKNLNQAMAQAIFLADGGNKSFNKFAEAILHSHGNIKDLIPSAAKMAQQLIDNTNNADQAHRMFDAFATKLHLSKSKADELWSSLIKLGKVHANPTVDTHVSGSGKVFAKEMNVGMQAKEAALTFLSGRAKGGLITEGTTPTADDVVARLSKGELVVPAKMVSAGLVDHLRGMIPGFAEGSFIGSARLAQDSFRASARYGGQFAADATKQFVQDMIAKFKHDLLSGSGESIVRDAMRWIGKIPYVWGGTRVPGGADCSGFTSTIYKRHGIHNVPRTSESQGSWVSRISTPVPGGLAFYHSPAGGADPGHVAIIGNNGKVISQGGGMGPQYENLRFGLPLLFMGIPPHGFPGGAGGGTSHAHESLGQLESIWEQGGGPGRNTAHIAAAIAMAESGGRADAVQQGQPPGLTGWGLWQITPTSGIRQNGQFGNLLNPLNNARAAVFLYRGAHGFRPWTTYNDGAYRRFYADGTMGAAPGWAWVGENGPELVKFHGGERVLDTFTSALAGFSGPGYATGTSEEHRRGLSLYREFRDAKTEAQVARDSRRYLQAIAAFYTGSARRTRDAQVLRQTKAMEDVARRLKSIQDDNKAAVAYKKTVYGNLSGYGALSGLDLGATPGVGDNVALSGGQGLLLQLQAKLATLRQFAAALKKLHALHLPNSLFRQIVDMGPDLGLQYANEILAGGASFIAKLAGIEKDITAEERDISRGAGSVIAGRGWVTSEKAFWNGIKNSQKDLERLFTHLGKLLGQEATKWFHVPPAPKHRRRGQLGGILREQVEGLGLSSGTHYSFGEAGDEVFAPLPPSRPGHSGPGGDTFIIQVAGDTDPDGAAYRIIQKIKDYKRHHGNQPLNL